MTDWVSIIINVLLLIITLGTVAYASKTLRMEYSSQVTVSRYKEGLKSESEYPYFWEVDIKNVGKGYVVKAFILLSVKSQKNRFCKIHHLSKPIVGLYPADTRTFRLDLEEEDIEKGDYKTLKLKVIYQDSLNNLYVVSPLLNNKNRHLETFDKLPKKMNIYGFKYWFILRKLKKAAKQGNTYPSRLKREVDREYDKYKKFEEGFKFETIDKEDTK